MASLAYPSNLSTVDTTFRTLKNTTYRDGQFVAEGRINFSSDIKIGGGSLSANSLVLTQYGANRLELKLDFGENLKGKYYWTFTTSGNNNNSRFQTIVYGIVDLSKISVGNWLERNFNVQFNSIAGIFDDDAISLQVDQIYDMYFIFIENYSLKLIFSNIDGSNSWLVSIIDEASTDFRFYTEEVAVSDLKARP